MNIVVLTHDYPPDPYGGIGIHMQGLYTAIVEANNDISIKIFVARNWNARRQTAENTKPHDRLEIVYFDSSAILCGADCMDIEILYYNHQVYELIVKHLADNKYTPNIIHTHTPILTSATMALKKKYEAQVVATEHSPISINALKDRVYFALRYYLYLNAAAIISVSKATANQIFEYYPLIDHDNLSVIPNGVYRLSHDKEHVRNKITYVGRLDPEKGVDTFIKAIALIDDSLGTEIEVTIIGTGEDLESLQNLALQNNLTRCNFIGKKDQKEVYEILQQSIIGVVPSREEPFGIVALEHMSNGSCVIASRVEGLLEIIKDGFDGRLFECDNIEELASTILDLYENQKKRSTLVENGYATASAFTWEGIAQQTYRLYSRVYNEGK